MMTPRFAKILPHRVCGGDQVQFFQTGPAFDLLLAGDGGGRPIEAFDINEAMNVVAACEA